MLVTLHSRITLDMDSQHSWMPHSVKRPLHYRILKFVKSKTFYFLCFSMMKPWNVCSMAQNYQFSLSDGYRWGRHVTAVMVTQCGTYPGAWGMSHYVTLTQYSTSSQRDMACPECTGVIKPSYWHPGTQHWILEMLTIFASPCIRNFDHHIILWTSSLQFDNHFWSVSSLLIVTFLGLGSDQVWWFCWNLNQGSLISSSVHLEYTHKITKLDNNKLQAWKSNY